MTCCKFDIVSQSFWVQIQISSSFSVPERCKNLTVHKLIKFNLNFKEKVRILFNTCIVPLL